MICSDEASKMPGWKIDIIGTDLSHEMIERAQSGIYGHFEVQRGLPVRMLVKYFQQTADKWQIKENIRKMVQFREGNLLHDFGPIGMPDIVYCRNVLTYFDAADANARAQRHRQRHGAGRRSVPRRGRNSCRASATNSVPPTPRQGLYAPLAGAPAAWRSKWPSNCLFMPYPLEILTHS